MELKEIESRCNNSCEPFEPSLSYIEIARMIQSLAAAVEKIEKQQAGIWIANAILRKRLAKIEKRLAKKGAK